jgi:STE24 endopeptidase
VLFKKHHLDLSKILTMTSEFVFYLIISLLVVNYLLESVLDYLNMSRLNKPIPKELSDVFEENEYMKSQQYLKAKSKFGFVQSTCSLALILIFLFLNGFEWLDGLAHRWVEHDTSVSLLFFGLLFLGSQLLSWPFDYYMTFKIEEEFGFNTTTKKTFWLDQLKSILLTIVLGGLILFAIIGFYQIVGIDFWWYAWILIAVFSVFMNMYYAKVLVPLFNKQTPLEDGDLRREIESYAEKMDFNLKNIFVIDGSKRSKKANAYFSGFGREKRITLFDTLMDELSHQEIVAVLAHEVGHYKKNHIIINLFFSLISLGFTLWLLSVFVSHPLLSQALGVDEPSFHIGLVAFSFLYAPISLITGLFTNYWSRVFEYQADNFAASTYSASYLASALKQLSKTSLSHLNPHPAYVFFNFSHPPLQERLKNLKNNS